ncbi:transducin family protein [Actinidia rufa]|uniref:Transducin family protein n=1 Tax=Actinidia rufa TaxID=165716 RepID=A0A7J0G0L5_9ERIC|nr:transducin family protein [Actinidia rufa]
MGCYSPGFVDSWAGDFIKTVFRLRDRGKARRHSWNSSLKDEAVRKPAGETRRPCRSQAGGAASGAGRTSEKSPPSVSFTFLLISLIFLFSLAGTGSQLLLYDLEKGRMVKSFHVFEGIRVHGITCSPINGKDRSLSSPLEFKIAVFGERRVKLFKLCIETKLGFKDHPKESIHLVLFQLLPKFSHWVLDVSFLKDYANSVQEGSRCLAIGCSDNSVCIWDILQSTIDFEVRCPDRCLLYSMRLWGDKVEALLIASGTIYNEIIVWKVVPRNHASLRSPVKDHVDLISSFDKGFQFYSQQYEVVHIGRLIGHEGSIFRIAWSSDGSKLISVSDDRSARLWEVHAERKEFDSSEEIHGSHSIGRVLFGHNARIWDCSIYDSLIVTAGEDCTCRVWGLDGYQLKMIREHIRNTKGWVGCLSLTCIGVGAAKWAQGRGIWRCLYDPNSSLLVTAGFDSALKAQQQLQASLFESSEMHAEEVKEITGRTKIFTVRIPHSSEHIGLMDSKSEYVRCLHFAREDTLYVATNNGYVYHAKLSNNGDVKWTELVQASEAVPIVCMDLFSRSSSNLSSTTEDWIAVGDGKGHMTIVSIVGDGCTPEVGLTFTWSAGLQRQLLGTYWCKSLGTRFIFTSDPRGRLRLWRLGQPLQSLSLSSMKSCDVSLIAEFVSCFGIRIMCLNASLGGEVLVCGDLRGNLVVFPLVKDWLLGTSVASEVISTLSYFKGAHGISSVCSISVASFSCSLVEICSVIQVACGGWRRPYSYYLGDEPEMKNCFAFVKDEVIYIHSCWGVDNVRGRYTHRICICNSMGERCILYALFLQNHSLVQSKSSFLNLVGLQQGVKMELYDPCVDEWSASKLLGEHVGGSARIERILCLLISVGAKRVLTCWKQNNRIRKFKEEAIAIGPDNGTGGGYKPSSGMSSSISFQWLSTDMPTKYCSTREIRENTDKEVNAENIVVCDSSYFSENSKTESKSCLGDKFENDWRYLAVTAFLVKVAYSRVAVCFVVVACSDATLTLRALLLPYRLWFDVASLVPLSSPVLALQHVITPMGNQPQVIPTHGISPILLVSLGCRQHGVLRSGPLGG